MTRHRLAIVASHPVQYQAPWFRALARSTHLTVLFCHRQDAQGQADAGFGVRFDWDVPLLEGYEHRWLNNISATPGVSAFGGCDTPDVADALGRGPFDACIVSGWYLKSYVQAIAACRKLQLPVLVRGDSQLGTPRSWVRSAAKYVPYRLMLAKVDGFLYVGQRNREYLEHYGVGDDRLFPVPHFVDNEYFSTRAAAARRDGRSAAVRADAGATETSFLLLFAGKLIGKKRPADLLEAADRARRRGLDVRVLVVGAGPLEAELRAQAAAFGLPVHFAGFRNQSELPACFAAADALVLPSDGGETWGLVVNEAMACGVPAIVSDAAGCAPDLVVPGETGWRYPCGDIGALADAIPAVRAMVTNDAGRVRTAVTSRIASYSVDAAVAGTLTALDSVLARDARGSGRALAAVAKGSR